MSEIIITILGERNEEPEFCQYWWNVYAFDVYCAVRDDDRPRYEKALKDLREFETHIRKTHPTILRKLKRPVEWS